MAMEDDTSKSISSQPERMDHDEFYDYLLLTQEMKERRLATPDRFEASASDIRDLLTGSKEEQRSLQEVATAAETDPIPSEALTKIIQAISNLTPEFRQQVVDFKDRIVGNLFPFWVMFFVRPCTAVPEFLDVIDALPLDDLHDFCPGITVETQRTCVVEDTLAEANLVCGTMTRAIEVILSKLSGEPVVAGCPEACTLWYSAFCTDCTDKTSFKDLIGKLDGIREGIVQTRASKFAFGGTGEEGADGSRPGDKIKETVQKVQAGVKGLADQVKENLAGDGQS